MSKNFYDVLGVSKTATDDEIKNAYRNLAMKYHPDKNQGDKESEKKFKEINEAYEYLKDPQKRNMYDRSGYNKNAGSSHHGGFEGFGEGFSNIFDDIFSGFGMGEDIFGNRRQPQQKTKGSDLLYNMTVTLEEAFKGAKKDITITALSKCDDCSGKGAKEDIKYKNCHTCQGKGKIKQRAGFFSIEQVCNSCNGEGKYIENPCKSCKGSGRANKKRVLTVDIPAGVQDGMRIRISGQGEAGIRGNNNGDLFIGISISNHKIFFRDADDLIIKITIPMIVAVLGDKIEIPCIDGESIELKIPNGTQNLQRFRVKSKGMCILNSKTRGDLYIDVNISIPSSLTDKQKEALKTLFLTTEKVKINYN